MLRTSNACVHEYSPILVCPRGLCIRGRACYVLLFLLVPPHVIFRSLLLRFASTRPSWAPVQFFTSPQPFSTSSIPSTAPASAICRYVCLPVNNQMNRTYAFPISLLDQGGIQTVAFEDLPRVQLGSCDYEVNVGDSPI